MADETGFDIREIAERLPHRSPMLLVDRVLQLQEGKSLVGIKNVSYNEDYFRGHFPGNPVMPGVLIIEALAQCAGLCIASSLPARGQLLPYLVGIDGAKFRRPVVPGDQLRLEVEIRRHRGKFWRFKGIASVGEERASEAEILLGVFQRAELGR